MLQRLGKKRVWTIVLLSAVLISGCGDSVRVPSDTEVQEYEQQMKSALQQEAQQQHRENQE